MSVMSKFWVQVGVPEVEEPDDDASFCCSPVLLAADVFLSEHVNI